jgi:hypothetical protein
MGLINSNILKMPIEESNLIDNSNYGIKDFLINLSGEQLVTNIV